MIRSLASAPVNRHATVKPRKPTYLRGLLCTTLSYMSWGGGAFLISLLGYGGYTLLK